MDVSEATVESSPPNLFTRLRQSAAAKDALYVVSAQALGTLIALGVDALLFRTLSMTERGMLSASLALQAVLLLVADLGLSLTTVRVGSEYVAKGMIAEANTVFRRALVNRLLLSTGIGAAAFFLADPLTTFPLNAGNRLMLVWAVAAGIIGTSVIGWAADVAQARRRFGAYFAQQVIAAVFRACIWVAMIYRLSSLDPAQAAPLKAELLLWGLAIASSFAGAICIFLQGDALTPPAPLSAESAAKLDGELSRFGLFAALTVILAGFGDKLEIFLVQHLLGADETAVYDGARRLAMVLPLLTTAIATVLLPRAAALDSLEACKRYVGKAFKVSLPLALVSAGGLALLASVLVPLFWSAKYDASVPALRWLCFGYAFNVLLNPVALVLYPLRREGTLLVLNALSIVLSVVAGYLLIPKYGAIGAAWSVAGVKAVIMLACGGVVIWALKNSRGIGTESPPST